MELTSPKSTEQNVSWNEQNPSYTYTVDSHPDPTFGITDNNDAELGNFFSRPITIGSFDWSPSISNFYQSFNPWNLFFEDPKVLQRVQNFKLLRSKLHVKILINGNGFYYGRLLASYKPLPTWDDLTRDRALVSEDNIAASQRPHIYIDPTTSQGGEMVLPFFFYQNAVSIPQNEWDDLGVMTIRTLNDLSHANGSVEPISITVLAWASDVVLSMPTSLEPQSGPERSRTNVTSNDEYGQGMVSKPASTVARIAGMLSSAPIIGPFAKATQIAASGVASIAKLFGYSRPATLAPVEEFVHRNFGNLATTNMPDNCQKLTLDAKQELTVDGRTVGLEGNDEMTISSIASRESYVSTTVWRTTDGADQPIFSMEVQPMCVDTFVPSGGAPDELHMTSLAFASAPFTYWRGTLKYRFQIVSSEYHKGRLKLQWDPYAFGDYAMNTQYTHIVDIATEKDFTIEVAWGHELGMLQVQQPLDVGTWLSARTSQTGNSSGGDNNGVLTLSVLNNLTSPSASAGDTVSINLFVSAGDDFELAGPTQGGIDNLTYYEPDFTSSSDLEFQSGTESVMQTDMDTTSEPSAPMQTLSTETLGKTQDTSDPSFSVYMGEVVTSFRCCLKRYFYAGMLDLGEDSTGLTKWRLQSLPPLPGFANADAVWGTTHNDNMQTLFSYLVPAYAAQRGGVKWKTALMGTGLGNYDGILYVKRVPSRDDNQTMGQTKTAINWTASGDVKAQSRLLQNTWEGTSSSSTAQNRVIEGEAPYQTNYRFTPARYTTYTTANNLTSKVDLGYIGSLPVSGGALITYISAGEDFSLYFYLGPPVMWDITSI